MITSTQPFSLKRLLWVGPLTILAAIIAVAVARTILLAVLNPAETFQPLSSLAYLPFTVIGVLGAVIAFAVIVRFTRNPLRVFHIVALVALVLTAIPNLLFIFNPPQAPANLPPDVPFPFLGGTAADWIGLVVLHVVAYAVSVWMLTTLTQEK